MIVLLDRDYSLFFNKKLFLLKNNNLFTKI